MKPVKEIMSARSLEVRRRAFAIWQKAGYNPWEKPVSPEKRKRKKSGDFYKGAFDSIPFLNDDAKRTFSHLMLRPGYMIREYIGGAHDRYLAPLTSLIVFYAFFALVAAVLKPVQHKADAGSWINAEIRTDSTAAQSSAELYLKGIARIVQKGYIYLHLDQFPEAVKTQRESSLAALEATLRSQGIPLFITEFLFLWLAMSMALRRHRLGMSACAAASAYVLCQFSFFMLFAVLLTWGRSSSISILLMFSLLVLDYHQWLGIEWRKSILTALRTGVFYGVIYAAVILLISVVTIVLAYFTTPGLNAAVS